MMSKRSARPITWSLPNFSPDRANFLNQYPAARLSRSIRILSGDVPFWNGAKRIRLSATLFPAALLGDRLSLTSYLSIPIAESWPMKFFISEIRTRRFIAFSQVNPNSLSWARELLLKFLIVAAAHN